MAKRIDAFAHVLPRAVHEELTERHPTDELAAGMEDARFWDMGRRLSDMDRFGIDRQVLTLARPSIWRGIDPATAVEITKIANDEVARIADENPDRFIPVATLPRLDDKFREEFDRCIEDLDMSGVQVFTNIEGQPVDARPFEWFWERASATDTPVWIHPQLDEWTRLADDYLLSKALGWPFETSLILSRLVFSGAMERLNLTVIPHHMGGMVPHFADRLSDFYEMHMGDEDLNPSQDGVELPGGVETYLQQFYGDTCRAGTPDVLEQGLEFFGEDRLVFATDYPFGPDQGLHFMEEEVQAVLEMDVTDRRRKKVFGENIATVLDC